VGRSHDSGILVVRLPTSVILYAILSVIFSLKNHGVDDEVNEMFQMGAETMALPMEEKMKYEQGDAGSSFG
jgi:hypothetical protein